MFGSDRLARASALLVACRERGLTIATAESCTGGLVAALLTEIAGSSDVFERGYVTYSNAAKVQAIGVPETLLATFGAVSAEVAAAMALGAKQAAQTQVSVAITGVAGPGGGTPEKPVGLVYLAAASAGDAVLSERLLLGDIGRSQVRMASLDAALGLLELACSRYNA